VVDIMSARKSEWTECVCDNKRAQDAILSWFHHLAEGMTPYKAEILCDIETDAEKKLRAFMTDADGNHYKFTRTCGGRYSIKREKIEPPRAGPRGARS
jgi:hypothetical protein